MTPDDDQLASWLHDEPLAGGSAGALERALTITRHMRQRPAWLVAATGGTIRAEPAGPSVLRVALVIGAVAVLTALMVGALVAGGILRLPSAPSPLAVESRGPSPRAGESDSPTPSLHPQVGVVAYGLGLGRGIGIVNVDGTGTREILADVPGFKAPLGWLPDGSRLVYMTVDDGGQQAIGLTDERGSERVTYGPLCPAVYADDVLASCHAELDSAVISPDGTSVGYAYQGRLSSWTPDDPRWISAIAILDVATGRIARLDVTESSNPVQVCDPAANQGENRSPTWSADGRSLAFIRDSSGPVSCPARALTVNADGSDLQVAELPVALRGQLPVWSPDGSAFFFNAMGDVHFNAMGDVHTGNADFTNIRAVIISGVDGASAWTRDGRIIFIRWLGTGDDRRGDLWVMDADGDNQARLEATVPALTTAGCVVCPYPVYDETGEAVVDPLVVREEHPITDFSGTDMFWQPMPGGQP